MKYGPPLIHLFTDVSLTRHLVKLYYIRKFCSIFQCMLNWICSCMVSDIVYTSVCIVALRLTYQAYSNIT